VEALHHTSANFTGRTHNSRHQTTGKPLEKEAKIAMLTYQDKNTIPTCIKLKHHIDTEASNSALQQLHACMGKNTSY